jgi:hypothetical protein
MAFEGTREVFARTEQNMLNTVARALTRAENGLNVYVSVRHIARDAEGEINTNLTRDFLGYFGDNAREQCKAAGASIEFTEQAGKSVRSTADSAFFETSPLMKSFVSNMAKNANADYVSAVAKAKLRSTAVSNEQAVREAVHDLADKGLFVNTYTDKNGRVVNVPVDVGVRQALQNSGKQRRMAQTLEIAEQTGNDLVEVNRTGNCRASHAEWQGRIYSISGKSSKYKSFYKACHVGDPVIGIGGYNCGHEFRIYRASQGRKFQDPITDPNYTTEQVRDLTSRQRYYERKLRALKREREMLKSAGLEHAEVSRKITGTQNALKSLIANNKTVLTRQADRERISPSAIKKSIAGGKNTAEEIYDEIIGCFMSGIELTKEDMRQKISRMVKLGVEDGKSAKDYLELGRMKKEYRQMIENSLEYIPTKMLKMLKAGRVKVKTDTKEDRSYYYFGFKKGKGWNHIVLGRDSLDDDTCTFGVVHESMHAIEQHNSAFAQAQEDYFNKRTNNNKCAREKLSILTGVRDYRDDEWAYDVENCMRPYCFKDYGTDAHELMSMGFEFLYYRPTEFGKDLDMLRWTLKMIERFGK